jgi:hypothetical protein
LSKAQEKEIRVFGVLLPRISLNIFTLGTGLSGVILRDTELDYSGLLKYIRCLVATMCIKWRVKAIKTNPASSLTNQISLKWKGIAASFFERPD